MVCTSGVCTDSPACVGDECPEGTADSDCDPGQECDDGSCFEVELSEDECFENDEGLCVRETCDGAECTPQLCLMECGPDQTQRGCECIDFMCQWDVDCGNDGRCALGECVECEIVDDCPDDEVCLDFKCVDGQRCVFDEQCPPDEQCADDNACHPRPQCVFDDDCDPGEACFNGRCTVSPECQVDLDCPMGMECVGGNCFLAVCRGPDDCENGQLCDAGECVDPPEVVECRVVTPNQPVVSGQRIPLEAFAFGADGSGVAATFVWTSNNDAVARVVPGPAALGGASAGTATVTATLANGQPCTGSAILTNPGPLMMGSLRVRVTDTESGAGVPGARVRSVTPPLLTVCIAVLAVFTMGHAVHPREQRL